MEENFDIDEHINKIKAQMGEDIKDPDNSMFRVQNDASLMPEEFLEDVKNDEPSLDNYAQNEPEEPAIEQNIEQQEIIEPQSAHYDQWQDPFGQIYENDAVKKYVIYISKDFVPYIDDLDTDARSAFINEALQLKTELDAKDCRWYHLLRVFKHVIISALVLLLAIPVLFWVANKSIIVTRDNYGYVQQSFEKLYKERADRERAMRHYRLNNPPQLRR